MIWVLVGMVVAAEAAKLGNTYLTPPPSAKESGGSDGALQLPLEPPYIDQYTPSEEKPEVWRPGTRSLQKDRKGSATTDKFLENEDEITIPALDKGRFISGSYSYTGPNNVLVTVTYKAGDRKERKEDEDAKVTEDNVAEEDTVEAEEEEEGEAANDEEQEEDGDLIVPTPPSLPAELARAFDFHKNKQLAQEAKTNRPKKPIRKTLKHKLGEKHGIHAGNNYGSGSGNHGANNYEGQYGQKIPGHFHGHKQGISGPAYQYPPPHQYGPPTISQGYSYPKAS